MITTLSIKFSDSAFLDLPNFFGKNIILNISFGEKNVDINNVPYSIKFEDLKVNNFTMKSLYESVFKKISEFENADMFYDIFILQIMEAKYLFK